MFLVSYFEIFHGSEIKELTSAWYIWLPIQPILFYLFYIYTPELKGRLSKKSIILFIIFGFLLYTPISIGVMYGLLLTYFNSIPLGILLSVILFSIIGSTLIIIDKKIHGITARYILVALVAPLVMWGSEVYNTLTLN